VDDANLCYQFFKVVQEHTHIVPAVELYAVQAKLDAALAELQDRDRTISTDLEKLQKKCHKDIWTAENQCQRDMEDLREDHLEELRHNCGGQGNTVKCGTCSCMWADNYYDCQDELDECRATTGHFASTRRRVTESIVSESTFSTAAADDGYSHPKDEDSFPTNSKNKKNVQAVAGPTPSGNDHIKTGTTSTTDQTIHSTSDMQKYCDGVLGPGVELDLCRQVYDLVVYNKVVAPAGELDAVQCKQALNECLVARATPY